MNRVLGIGGFSLALVLSFDWPSGNYLPQELSSQRDLGLVPSNLPELITRGFTYRLLDNKTIEIEETWSGVSSFKTLEEPSGTQIRTWAASRGVPVLEIDPTLIDTNQYVGWYTYWTEVPMSNSLGIPLIVDDIDNDGKADVYGTFKDFMSPDFEAHVHEVDSNGTVEFGYNYVPRPGVSRLTANVDRDSLREIIFSFSGGVYDYEQATSYSLPTQFRFRHERHQGRVDPGYTGIYVGFLDDDNFTDLLYKGSEPDSTNPNLAITKVYVAEYHPDSTNFVRVWSTIYVPGPQTGIGGFAVDDFDGDGRKEFASCDLWSGQVFVTENVGNNDFATTWHDSTPFVNLYYVTCGDVDDDDRPEFFVGATMSNGNWTLVYEADSNDNYSLQFLFHLYAGGVLDSPVYLTRDVDGDSTLELVVFSGAYLHIFKARADNDYRLFFLKRESNRLSVQFHDFDGNGISDFLVGKDELDSVGRFRRFANVYKGTTLVHVVEEQMIPTRVPLLENYPNPFNGSTTIQYSIPVTERVMIRIYDVLGGQVSELVSEIQSAGSHKTSWDATGFASGIYFCRLTGSSFTITRKFLLLR
jgi:hypothetical protein